MIRPCVTLAVWNGKLAQTSSSVLTRSRLDDLLRRFTYIYSHFWYSDRTVPFYMTRRRDYNLTDITVRLLGSKPVTGGEHDEGLPQQRGSHQTKQEFGPRTTGGTRQSKRIRQGRDRRENTRLRISKSTTVKDIKVKVRPSLHPPFLFSPPSIDSIVDNIQIKKLVLLFFFPSFSCTNRSRFRRSVKDCFTRIGNSRTARSQLKRWVS